MSKTNCINCGAAKDTDEIRCPFCGTTYLDFTAIDFSSRDPVVCQFVLPFTKERTVMSMLAIPQLEEISAEPVRCDYVDPFGTRLTMLSEWEMNVGVSFKPVSRKNILFTLKQEGR